jgi:hypothetical protein
MALLGPKTPLPYCGIDLLDKLNDATPLLGRISPTSSLLRVAPSLCLASVLSSLWVCHLEFSFSIKATGSHVPHKGLGQGHAISMPDAIQAGYRLLLDLSRANDSSRF